MPKSDNHTGLNRVDESLLDFIWRRGRPQLPQKIKQALEDGVRTFSDLQIVTGIAILSAGYSQLHRGIISFDWQILVYAAWFSSVTHLTTLTMIRHYFQRRNSIIRGFRCFLMLCVIAMLIAALLPTGHHDWFGISDDAGTPAICYFFSGLDVTSNPTRSLIISIVVLLASYLNRVIKLFSISSQLVREYSRSKPGNLLKELIQWAKYSRLRMPIYDILLIQLVILRALFDFFESVLWEVCTCTAILLQQPSRYLTRNPLS